MSALEFLGAIMDGHHVHSLCAAANREKRWLGAVGFYRDPDELLDAAAVETAKGNCVWFGVHPLVQSLTPPERGGDDDVAFVRVIPVDLDWLDPVHADADLLPEHEVRSLLAGFEHQPSFIVETSHGLQAYWTLSRDLDPDRGHHLTGRMHTALARLGLKPERGDLASVLRVPGSFNFKDEPAEVRLIAEHPDRRYQPEYLEKRLPGASKRSGGRRSRWKELDETELHPLDLKALKLLEEAGGHDPYIGSDGCVCVVRPGKEAGTGATIGFAGPGLVKMFSASWPPFTRDAVYDIDELRDLVDGKAPTKTRTRTNEQAEPGGAPLADGLRASDVGNADRLVREADGRIRYVASWTKWVVYEEGRWIIDSGDALVTEVAKRVPQALFRLAGDTRDKVTWACACAADRSGSIAAMIKLARGIPGIWTPHDVFDSDPCLLNVLNGTIDLRDGTMRAAKPDDLLTMQAPVVYDPAARAPVWDACMARWQPDPEVRAFLQRVLGSAITGHPVEAMFVNVGPGGNGKSKAFGAVTDVLGPYSVVAHKSLLVSSAHEQHPTHLASLFRARMVVAPETTQGDRLNEEGVKNLTGGDLLRARRMREDEWSFRPTHSAFLHTNHRPQIRGTDEGIWRRLKLIPWNITIPADERDENLAHKLRAEASGILNWLIQGALEWQRVGLAEPEIVIAATREYRLSEDQLGRFITECCLVDRLASVTVRDLRDAYEGWCDRSGERAQSVKEISAQLLAIDGVDNGRVGKAQTRTWLGLGLLNTSEPTL